MESIYYVVTWLCHRTCVHCYEDRFRPYHGDDLRRVVEESKRNAPRVIANFPPRMTYLDPNDGMREKRGRVILAGGEILLDPVREPVLYPALEQLRGKYGSDTQLIIQTTGDTITPKIVAELIERGVFLISVSGIDEYHAGLEQQDARDRLQEKLRVMFSGLGLREVPLDASPEDGGPYFHFFGAQPDLWIGRLWPRGRAHANGLSKATLADNFCNRWSGGLHFLQYRLAGSEVSVDPAGNVYPCCIKTKAPVGNLLERPLEEILDGLIGNPVYEAISMGHPERMGIARGWSVEKFLEKSSVTLPDGRIYRNLCVGCDVFHEEVLIPEASLVRIG